MFRDRFGPSMGRILSTTASHWNCNCKILTLFCHVDVSPIRVVDQMGARTGPADQTQFKSLPRYDGLQGGPYLCQKYVEQIVLSSSPNTKSTY